MSLLRASPMRKLVSHGQISGNSAILYLSFHLYDLFFPIFTELRSSRHLDYMHLFLWLDHTSHALFPFTSFSFFSIDLSETIKVCYVLQFQTRVFRSEGGTLALDRQTWGQLAGPDFFLCFNFLSVLFCVSLLVILFSHIGQRDAGQVDFKWVISYLSALWFPSHLPRLLPALWSVHTETGS